MNNNGTIKETKNFKFGKNENKDWHDNLHSQSRAQLSTARHIDNTQFVRMAKLQQKKGINNQKKEQSASEWYGTLRVPKIIWLRTDLRTS